MDKAKMIANKVASSVPKTIDEATLLNYYCSFKLCLLPTYPLIEAVCPIYFLANSHFIRRSQTSKR